MKTKDLISTIAENSPAPGGGSVSALVGSLGSALLSMVALLTYEKKDFLKARSLRSHGITRESSVSTDDFPSWFYRQNILGYNFRMSEFRQHLAECN